MSAFNWCHFRKAGPGNARRRTRLSRAKAKARKKLSAKRRAYDHPGCSLVNYERHNGLATNGDDHRGHCRPNRAYILPRAHWSYTKGKLVCQPL